MGKETEGRKPEGEKINEQLPCGCTRLDPTRLSEKQCSVHLWFFLPGDGEAEVLNHWLPSWLVQSHPWGCPIFSILALSYARAEPAPWNWEGLQVGKQRGTTLGGKLPAGTAHFPQVNADVSWVNSAKQQQFVWVPGSGSHGASFLHPCPMWSWGFPSLLNPDCSALPFGCLCPAHISVRYLFIKLSS